MDYKKFFFITELSQFHNNWYLFEAGLIGRFKINGEEILYISHHFVEIEWSISYSGALKYGDVFTTYYWSLNNEWHTKKSSCSPR